MIENCLVKIFSVCLIALIVTNGEGIVENRKVHIDDRLTHLPKQSDVRGYLNVVLELSTSEPQNGYRNDVTVEAESRVKVCLASKSSGKVELDKIGNWDIGDCVETNKNKTTEETMSLQLYDVIRIPLTLEKTTTHLVVMNTPKQDIKDDVMYWSALPLTFPNDDVITRVRFTSFGDISYSILATLSLTCAPNNFGPRCAITCVAPNLHHRCDKMTGELKCAGTWTEDNCDRDNNVFISQQAASRFIKKRRKRANTWLRIEEVQAGNLERECEEEVCSREEAREALDDDEATAEYWRVYTDPNQCVPNPCVAVNTVRCEDLLRDYNCHCRPGYTGKRCSSEIDVCESQPCRNGATCQNRSSTAYTCFCAEGFRGPICEVNIDDCENSNCGDHGTCVDGINSFRCTCDLGFTGEQCDIDINECENNPCLNGGNCTNYFGFYTCQCTQGYEGDKCQNRINPCMRMPCLNGGQCSVNPDGSFTCACPDRYTGVKCEDDLGEGK